MSQRRRSTESATEPMPLYPDERRIALAVMGLRRAREWPEKAAVLERHGLPKIDAVMGGRYWPAVRRFFDDYNGLGDARHKNGALQEAPDLKKAAARARRTRRRAIEVIRQDRRSSRD